MMEVVVKTEAIRHAKLQSNCHHQQTNTQLSLQVRWPFCHPNNSVTALPYLKLQTDKSLRACQLYFCKHTVQSIRELFSFE